MPFQKVSSLQKSVASVKNLSVHKKKKSFDVFQGKVYMLNAVNDDSRTSIIQILKSGEVRDRGLVITEEMINEYVQNFHDNSYGSPIQVNFGHNREGEAAGWLTNIFAVSGELFAEVQWTPVGQDKVQNKQYMFTSAELAPIHLHHETGQEINNVLIGVALTNVPAVKGMAAVDLSEKVKLYLNNNNDMDKKINLSQDQAPEQVKEEDKNPVEQHEEEENEQEVVDEDEDKDVPEQEEKEQEEKKEDEEENLSEKSRHVSLSEHLALQKETQDLRKKIELSELNEVVKDKLLFSQTNKIGFRDELLPKVTNFMVNLSEKDRDTFIQLCSQLQTIDLSTIGSTNAFKRKELNEDNVVDLSEKIMKDGKADNIETAQKMAIAELSQ